MNSVTVVKNQCAIVYDGDCIKDPSAALFDPDSWIRNGCLAGHAPGRGSALFLDAPFGRAVLRLYLRGGWPARISRDRYVFTGLKRSRPFREFSLLAELFRAGLPVPAPLAAMCERGVLTYRGALLTRLVAGADALGDLLTDQDLPDQAWSDVGACLARFHKAGVYHADLNVRNILLRRSSGEVFLVDFDRSVFRPGRSVNGHANLARLYRSVQKSWPSATGDAIDARWNALMDGYRG